MFHKLRLQLLLLNLAIIILFITVTGLRFPEILCIVFFLFISLFMINRAISSIQKSWLEQKDFLADVSHEFRTPLAIIQTNLEIMRDTPEESVRSQEHWLGNIYEETLGMTKLVDALMFLARADCQQQVLTKHHFSLNQATLIAAELFHPIALVQGVTLTVNAEMEIPYYADEGKLRQVISILVDNAIRHTPTGGTVTIHLENSQQDIHLSVIDTGAGFNPEHNTKIFERFYQSDSPQGGTGLGLSIAKWIVDNHHGNISAISTPGRGSIFTVSLPHL